MPNLFVDYKRLRSEGSTPTEASKALGIKSSYRYERKLASDLGSTAYADIQTTASRKAQKGRASISYSEGKDAASLARLSRLEIGSLAEDLAFYKLRRHGLDAYRPLHPARYDFVVIEGSVAFKIQVKSTISNKPSARLLRNSYDRGAKAVKYKLEEVDFFILVDLFNENVFVVPHKELIGRNAVALRPGSDIWIYKDRYDLITAT